MRGPSNMWSERSCEIVKICVLSLSAIEFGRAARGYREKWKHKLRKTDAKFKKKKLSEIYIWAFMSKHRN